MRRFVLFGNRPDFCSNKMNADEIIAQSSFSMLKGKIDERILKTVNDMGFEKPTRVQAESLPFLLQHKDLIGAAKTGSGKTLAFLIPVVNNLIKSDFDRKKETGSIILSPTRELALQTFEVLKKLLVDIDLTHSLIVGGEKKYKDVMKLQKGVNIVVSTPGRLLDHLQSTEGFNCSNLKCLVVDEADKLLEAGFEKHVTGIIKLLPRTKHAACMQHGSKQQCFDDIIRPPGWWYDPRVIDHEANRDREIFEDYYLSENRQTVLFSATIDSQVQNLARLALRSDPVHVIVTDERQSTVSGLQQGYCICPVEQRMQWLVTVLKKSKKKKVMVFFSSCKSVDFHYDIFRRWKASVISIHGRLSQAQRKLAYHKFVQAQKGVLFCTDVAARGLDIPAVDWIVQYDPPTDPKEYIHRVGRTARGMNSTGNAVILLRPEEEKFVQFLKKEKVYLDKYNFGEPSPDLQEQFEDLIDNDGVMKISARKAFLSFLRCYQKHPMKDIFSIKTLDLKAAARAFGFRKKPDVDFYPSWKLH